MRKDLVLLVLELKLPKHPPYRRTPIAPATAAARPNSGANWTAAPFVGVVAGAAVVPVAAGPEVEEAEALLVELAPAAALTSLGFSLPQLELQKSAPGLAVLHCWKARSHSSEGRVWEYCAMPSGPVPFAQVQV